MSFHRETYFSTKGTDVTISHDFKPHLALQKKSRTRCFFKSLTLVSSLLSGLLFHEGFAQKAPPQMQGILVHCSTMVSREGVQIPRLLKTRVNTVFLSVNECPSRMGGERITDFSKENELLSGFIERLHSEGIAVVAWMEHGISEQLFDGTDVKLSLHPQWLQSDSQGISEGMEPHARRWISPSSEEGLSHFYKRARDLADPRWKFDGIMLDRMRWTRQRSVGRDFGYEAKTLDLFRKKYATKEDFVPQNFDPRFVDFRAGLIDALVKKTYQTIKSVNPLLPVVSSVLGTYGYDANLQRWNHWLEGGFLDFVYPQIYNVTKEDYVGHLEEALGIAGGNKEFVGVTYRKGELPVAQNDADTALAKFALRHSRAKGLDHFSVLSPGVVNWTWEMTIDPDEMLKALSEKDWLPGPSPFLKNRLGERPILSKKPKPAPPQTKPELKICGEKQNYMCGDFPWELRQICLAEGQGEATCLISKKWALQAYKDFLKKSER